MGNCYKALIDSGAATSVVRYSTYQHIDNSLKTTIQARSINLNTADGSPMMALGIMTLQLSIADFKFFHNFVICDRLSDVELLFGIYVQKKSSHYPMLGTEKKNCCIQKEDRFLTYTKIYEQKANVATVKSALKTPPRHNGIIPIRVKGHTFKGHMSYFISDQDSKKEKDPNIHIIDVIHKIKGKNICQCPHLKLHQQTHHLQQKGTCRTSGTSIEDMQQIPDNPESITTQRIATKIMMARKVEPDTFKPLRHKLEKYCNKTRRTFKGIQILVCSG